MNGSPRGRRSVWRESGRGLEISIPSKRNIWILKFLSGWLLMWSQAEFWAILQLISGRPSSHGARMLRSLHRIRAAQARQSFTLWEQGLRHFGGRPSVDTVTMELLINRRPLCTLSGRSMQSAVHFVSVTFYRLGSLCYVTC
jgi:hypothetical protein